MKIAVCIPVYGSPRAEFTHCLANMIARTAIAPFVVNGEPARPNIVTKVLPDLLPMGRNRLTKWALDEEADFILWLDADMTFPSDSLLRLLTSKKEIVAANYPRRHPEKRPTASTAPEGDDALVHSTAERGLEQVPYIGFGLCLMTGPALRKLWGSANAEMTPLFHFELLPDGGYRLEDYHFCDVAKREGVPIYVDHALSVEVGHIAETVLKF